MKTFFLFTLLLFLLPQSGYGQERPNWLESPRKEDAQYKYYVGRSSESPGEAIGFQEATQDAYEQAIRENFGITTGVNAEAFETENTVSVTKRVRSLSKQVPVTGFEQVDFRSESGESGKFQVWILFRYRKTDIDNTRDWLTKHPGAENTQALEREDQNPQFKGSLEVVTEPPGASVSIDGVPVALMQTPLRLTGQIPLGKHELVIEHPEYEPIRESFIMGLGRAVKIHKLLRRGFGYLNVESDPQGAIVSVNGKNWGRTPIHRLKQPAGSTLKLELAHPHAQGYSQELQLDREEEKTVSATLTLNPAYLSVSSSPPGAAITIASVGIVRKTPTGIFSIPPGSYNLHLEKAGYGSADVPVSLAPGQRKVLGIVALKKNGALHLNSVPTNAEVSVEGSDVHLSQSTPLNISLPPGHYDLTVRKEGFDTYTTSAIISAGETARLPLANLTAETHETHEPPEPDLDHHSLLSFDFFGTSAPTSTMSYGLLGVGAAYQYRPCKWIGFEGELSYVTSGQLTYANGNMTVSGWTSRLGLPIYIFPNAAIAISPEWIHASLNYAVTGGASSGETDTSSSQDGFGASIEWVNWPKDNSKSGLSLRFGVHQYGNSNSSFKGSLGVSGGIGWGFGL